MQKQQKLKISHSYLRPARDIISITLTVLLIQAYCDIIPVPYTSTGRVQKRNHRLISYFDKIL